jgi:hypothetical protein
MSKDMSCRTCFLLTVSILAAASCSCHGPETGALNPKIAVESDKSSSTQGSLDTEAPKSETKAKVLEPNRSRDSRVDRMLYEKKLMPLVGLVDSFM